MTVTKDMLIGIGYAVAIGIIVGGWIVLIQQCRAFKSSQKINVKSEDRTHINISDLEDDTDM